MKKSAIFFLLIVIVILNGNGQNNLFIPFNDRHIQYEGRIEKDCGDATKLFWSGTTVRIRFQGTGLKALMKDQTGTNFYNVILDGDSIFKMQLDTIKQMYVLAKNLPEGKHTIELFKVTQIHKEYNRGYTDFYGFELDKDSKPLNPSSPKKRKIEFYGNSVTCGHAIEDTTGGDSGAGKYENNYLSYAALTARHFNAGYSCIAKSGIGLMVSWAPLIMPEMYSRLNPLDSLSLWDFSKNIPDVVVINLFQNDCGILNRPDFSEYKRRFGTTPPEDDFIVESYQAFLQSIREKYPRTHIICCLGSMDATKEGSKWPGYIEEAVERMEDKRIYTHFFPYKNTPGHPRVKDHEVMAESLIKFIDSHRLFKRVTKENGSQKRVYL